MPTGATRARRKICGSSPGLLGAHSGADRQRQGRYRRRRARSLASECPAFAPAFAQQFRQAQHARRLAGSTHSEIADADHRHVQCAPARIILRLPAPGRAGARPARAPTPPEYQGIAGRYHGTRYNSRMAATARAVAPRRASAHSRARAPTPPSSARTRSTAPASSSAPADFHHRAGRAKLLRDGRESSPCADRQSRASRRAPAREYCVRREPPASRP